MVQNYKSVCLLLLCLHTKEETNYRIGPRCVAHLQKTNTVPYGIFFSQKKAMI